MSYILRDSHSVCENFGETATTLVRNFRYSANYGCCLVGSALYGSCVSKLGVTRKIYIFLRNCIFLPVTNHLLARIVVCFSHFYQEQLFERCSYINLVTSMR